MVACGGVQVSSGPAIAPCWPCRGVVVLSGPATFRQASGGVDLRCTLTVGLLEGGREFSSLALYPRRRLSHLGPLVELACPTSQAICAIVYEDLSSSLTWTPWLLLWFRDCSLEGCKLHLALSLVEVKTRVGLIHSFITPHVGAVLGN